ncbi:hypothetical protein [Flavobacterium sp.]|uniref:hypothetical protein n=1 Tax=Flavobacterium sp. TaxID=239 RepID=UPI003750638B
MQKIKYPYRNEIEKETFINAYFEVVSTNIKYQSKICNEIKKIDKNWDLKKLLTADFNELVKFVKSFNKYIKKTIILELKRINVDQNELKYIDEYFEKYFDNNKKIKSLNNLTPKEEKDKLKRENLNKGLTKKRNEINSSIKRKLNIISNSIKSPYENKTIFDKIIGFINNENNELKKNKITYNLKTCHFCNIDFINSFSVKDKKKNHFTLDHFLQKSKYPYLSISLFNLIPSCYSCNTKFKGQMEFDSLDNLHKISPSSEMFNLDQQLEFKLKYNVEEYIDNNKDIVEIELTNLANEKDFDKFIQMFNLEGRYEFHNEISNELIRKRKIYSDSQLDEIEKIFHVNNISIDKETLKKQIFGSVIFEKENTNEPFEKYKKDIAKQLGLI